MCAPERAAKRANVPPGPTVAWASSEIGIPAPGACRSLMRAAKNVSRSAFACSHWNLTRFTALRTMNAPYELPLPVSASRPHLTASHLMLRSLLSFARARGVQVGPILQRLGIARMSLGDADARMPDSTLQRVWAELTAATADDTFGTQFAEHAQEGEFGVVDYAMYFSSSAGDALERITQFYRLLSDALAIAIVRENGVTRVRRLVHGTHPQEQDAFFALLCLRLRRINGEVRPREVRLEHRPHAATRLAAVFGCPVRFGAEAGEIVLASSDLVLPAHAAKPRLVAVLDRYAADLLAQLPATATYADYVRHAIARAIQHGSPTLVAVAREMHSSARTIQRRLTDSGTTHKELVDDVRRQLALRYLQSPKLSLTEIAFLLGYEDAGSFRRTVKRWTGKTPSELRPR